MSASQFPKKDTCDNACNFSNKRKISECDDEETEKLIKLLSQKFGNCRPVSEFKWISYLGEGSYGTVYKAKDEKNDRVIALKQMKMSEEKSLSTPILQEINILKQLKEHENIINVFGIALERDFDSRYYLILEYCEYELSKIIDDDNFCTSIKEPQIKCIMHQLFKGLNQIHLQGIIHRDIAPSNMLFTSSGILKIADFGTACLKESENMSFNVGTQWYRTPELLFGSRKYTSAIDMWSAACIFAEVHQKAPLFKANSDIGVLSLIIDLIGSPNQTVYPGYEELSFFKICELRNQPINKLKSFFSGQTKGCIDLFEKLLVYDPKIRYTAADCLLHSYFSETPLACSPDELAAALKSSIEA